MKRDPSTLLWLSYTCFWICCLRSESGNLFSDCILYCDYKSSVVLNFGSCITMPPTWSNGQVMTNTECSNVKQLILKQRGRRYPTWGRDVPLPRYLVFTQGRKRLPLFRVSVDVEDEQNTLNLCTDEVHSGRKLPAGPLNLIFLELILVKTF